MTSKIVVGDMWPVVNFGDPNERFKKFVTDQRESIKRFVEALITHDKVLIPTDDYMSLVVALHTFGEDGVLTLIENNTLGFLRIKGGLGYVGGGAGLRAYAIQSKEGPMKPFCAPMDDAIEWAIGGLLGSYDKKTITRAVTEATTELATSVVWEQIRKETIDDVTASPDMAERFGLTGANVDSLPGIGPAGVMIYGGESPSEATNEIEALLRLAHANLELRAAEEVDADDLSTSCPIGHVLKAKRARVDNALSGEQSWSTLREITELPDVAETVLQDRGQLQKLIKLRSSANGREFRSWFQDHCRKDPTTTGKEYGRLLKSGGLLDGGAGRAFRFIATTGVGLLFGDASGAAAGAVDSFVVDRLLRRPSAKIFIERLEQFQPLNE